MFYVYQDEKFLIEIEIVVIIYFPLFIPFHQRTFHIKVHRWMNGRILVYDASPQFHIVHEFSEFNFN